MSNSKNAHKIITILSVLIIVGICAVRLKGVKPFQVQKLLRSDHPLRISYENFNEKYNDEDKVYILLSSSQELTSQEIDNLLDQASKLLKRNRGVNNISHLSNSRYISYEDNHFFTVPFIKERAITQSSWTKLQSPFWENQLITQDKQNLVMTVTLSSKMKRSLRIKLVRSMRGQIQQLIKPHQHLQSYFVGTEVANDWFTHEMVKSAKQITPILFLTFGLFLLYLFRSFKAVLLSYAVIAMAYAGTGILVTYLENGIGPYSNFALFFVIIVSTSDLIHFFVQYKHSHSNLEETISKIRTPCLLTSVTTAIGFSSLLINENVPLIYLGVYSIFGTFFAYFLTFYYIPFAVKSFNIQMPSLKEPKTSANFLWLFIRNHYHKILLSFFCFISFLIYHSFDQNIDDNYYNKFNAAHPLTRAIHQFKQKLGFVGSIDITLVREKEDILSEQSIEEIKKFEQEILEIKSTTSLKSYTQFYDNMKQELAKDFSPQRVGSITQMLYNYGILNSLYKQTANELRTTLFLESLNSTTLENTIAKINMIKKDYPSLTIEVNGFAAIRNYIGQNVIKNYARSIGFTFILIALVFLYLFRSIKWSIIAIIPNLFPLILICGLMGFYKISVDNNLLILISITLGISVDDTIHFIYKLRQSLKETSLEEAVKSTVQTTLIPLLSTTGIFILCFPSFFLSDVVLFEQIGLFLMLSLLMAFLCDFLLLPAILLCFHKEPQHDPV